MVFDIINYFLLNV